MNSKTKYPLLSIIIALFSTAAVAQTAQWQQAVDYTMDVTMNVKDHTFEGTQKLIYTNNSPDTLTRVYYHLYFNAFQPGSMMDVDQDQLLIPAEK